MTFSRRLFIACCASIVAGAAYAQDDFYAGKTVRMISFSAPGGGFDAYTRLMARHIGKHLPGSPNVVVENITGASGLVALNDVAVASPQDGTAIMLATPGLVTHEVTGQPGLPVSLRELNWIGNLEKANPVQITWHSAAVKTIEDAKSNPVRVGATGVASGNAQIPWAYNYLLGTKFEVIVGYAGSGEYDMAMERGELDGRSVTSYTSYMAGLPEDVRPKINLLIQLGTEKDPRVPENVPLLLDLVKGDPDKEALARFLTAAFASMNRPFLTGPGVPPERVAVIRRAFDDTVVDPEFLADAKSMGAEITPTSGEDLQKLIDDVLSFPPEIVEKVKVMLDVKA